MKENSLRVTGESGFAWLGIVVRLEVNAWRKVERRSEFGPIGCWWSQKVL